jgi:hypothetical protein
MFILLQEAQLPHLTWLWDQLTLNDDFGDVFAAHEAFLCCANFLLVSLVICVASMLVCGFHVQGVPIVQGAVPCQQHWHQVHAISGVEGVHTR